jgi:hypothetical protein
MSWVEVLGAASTPSLPLEWALQWGRSIAWALVLACIVVLLLRKQALVVRAAAATGLALWALLPGEASPTFWLGLAFQSPSWLGCGLAVLGLWRGLSVATPVPWTQGGARVLSGAARVGAWVGVWLGYVLLLDTLGYLPLQVYAWGFSPWALAAVMAVSVLPLVLGARGVVAWMAPLALLCFAATRLPTGNVWDAVLDPLTWLVLHALLLVRARARSATRA